MHCMIGVYAFNGRTLKSAANILTHNLTSSLTYTLINSQNNSEITNFLGHFLIPNGRIMVSVLAPTPYY